MKRRGFLFGLFAAPLVPVVAKAAPAAAASRGHRIAHQLLPGPSPWRKAWLEVASRHPGPISRIVDGARVYDEAYLRRAFADVPPEAILEIDDCEWRATTAAWPKDWRSLAEATIDRETLFTGATPRGRPVPIPADDDPNVVVWVDGDFCEILRVSREVPASAETTSGRSCEAVVDAQDELSLRRGRSS